MRRQLALSTESKAVDEETEDWAATRIVYELAPDYNLQRSLNRFFGNLTRQDWIDGLTPLELGKTTFEYGFRLRRLLENFESEMEIIQRHRTPLGKIRRCLLLAGVLALMLIVTPSLMQEWLHANSWWPLPFF